MRNPPSWPRTLTRALLCGVLAWTTACGDREKEGAQGAGAAGNGEAEQGGTAILAELADINKPMPLLAETVLDGELGGDVFFLGLTRGVWRDGRLEHLTAEESPLALARSYAYTGADSAALRYHMRSGLRWSDGKPITAHDVVWTYQLLADPAVASPQQQYTEHLDSVRAENDSTVVFYFDRRYPEMLVHSGLGIAPKHLFEGRAPRDIRSHPALVDPSGGRLVVSGPFKIGAWAKGSQVTLVPNEHSPVKPNLDQVVIRVIPEGTTRLVELQTGRVDFAFPVPHDQVPRLRAQAPNVRFGEMENRQYDFVAYNPKGPEAFRDREVREALGLAIDVQGIIRALQMQDFATPIGGPYSPALRDVYDPQRMAPLPYDTARARRILESKGWRDTNGDGVLDRNGKPFRFTLLTNSGNPRRRETAEMIQAQWRRIGVDANIQMMELNTFFDRLQKKDFEAALSGWIIGLSPDIAPLWARESPNNFVSYDNPRTFSLFEQALSQPTEEQAARYWKEAGAQIAADRPYTFLFSFDQLVGLRDRLKGVRVNTYGAYQNMGEWWIPQSQQRQQPAAPAARTDTTPAK
jgi:peptide/nickel transport system substrate-binding protein